MNTWAKSLRTQKILNEWTYWVSVFGRPSLTEPWGWQLDGHHVNLNVFVLRGQVVISPVFVGAEPRTCGTGKFAGTSVLTEFDEPAVALMEALSGGQRQRAVLHPSILSPYHGKPTAARRQFVEAALDETLGLVEVVAGGPGSGVYGTGIDVGVDGVLDGFDVAATGVDEGLVFGDYQQVSRCVT